MAENVYHLKTDCSSKEEFLKKVENVMKIAGWQQHVRGKKVFLKINLLSNQLVPGQCTSPWVIEGVVRVLQKAGKEITMGDGDVCSSKQVEEAAQVWGVMDIARKYKIKFVNLSKQKNRNVNIKGKILKELPMPEILLDADSIITIAVAKTHNITTVTGSLKNQWGCIPRFRHQFHPVAAQCIADINRFLKVSFAVLDATVSFEGKGPRVGIPKITNSIFASNDRVALDSAMAWWMGFNPETIGHIKKSEESKVGSMKYKIAGDPIKRQKFIPSILKNHPIVRVEMALRKIPVVRWFVFNTPFFNIPSWIASQYNSVWYYYTKGKKYAKQVLKNPLYNQEFSPLIKK